MESTVAHCLGAHSDIATQRIRPVHDGMGKTKMIKSDIVFLLYGSRSRCPSVHFRETADGTARVWTLIIHPPTASSRAIMVRRPILCLTHPWDQPSFFSNKSIEVMQQCGDGNHIQQVQIRMRAPHWLASKQNPHEVFLPLVIGPASNLLRVQLKDNFRPHARPHHNIQL